MRAIVEISKHADPLTKVCGLTLIERTLLSLHHAGVTDISIRQAPKDLQEWLSKRKLPFAPSWLTEDVTVPEGAITLFSDAVINREHIQNLLRPDDLNPRAIHLPVQTSDERKNAEYRLLQSCRKPGEAISSHYYRYISLWFSKYLCRTPITPNQISIFFPLFSLLGAYFITMPYHWVYFLGLLLQPFAIVLDCCDGEVARLKYQFSKAGEWIDTIADNFCTFFFIGGVAIANHKLNGGIFNIALGWTALGLYSVSILGMLLALKRHETSGSLNVLNRKFKKDGGSLKRLAAVVMKRNSVTILFVLMGFFHLTQSILWASIIGSMGLIIFSTAKLSKRPVEIPR